MIFKRPNAFIIKHLKLIHAIILICLTYSLIKTSNISNTYNHIVEVKSIIGQNYTSILFNALMFLLLITGLILSIAILIILIKKKKNFIFYILLIVLFVGTLIFDILSYANIAEMQKRAVSAQTYLAYGDFSKIIFYLQSIFVFIVLFKATGFDLKTLSFGKVSGIDLTEADSEEIEFNLEIDSNELRTKNRRKFREFKYKYKENKLKINLSVISVILIILIALIISANANKTMYLSLKDELSTRQYSIIVDDAYLTNLDINGNQISSRDIFLIMVIKLKKNIDAEYKFNYSKILVEIEGQNYNVSPKYFEYFSDFGEAYKEQNLTKEYIDYYLVYQLPYEYSSDSLNILIATDFNYKTNKYDYYKIKTNYKKMNELKTISHEYKLKEQMPIDAYGVKNNVIINKVEFESKYKITVEKEVGTKKYELVEYLVPTAADNEEKAIMKINYKSDDLTKSFSTILSKYRIIEYRIGEEQKEGKIYSFLSPKLVKEANTYYIQVSKKVLEGTDKCIKVKIRNHIFKYYLDNIEEEI